MISKEENIGSTPAGGVRSEAYFFDAADNPCSKTEAVKIIIVEFDADDMRICETVAIRASKE